MKDPVHIDDASAPTAAQLRLRREAQSEATHRPQIRWSKRRAVQLPVEQFLGAPMLKIVYTHVLQQLWVHPIQIHSRRVELNEEAGCRLLRTRYASLPANNPLRLPFPSRPRRPSDCL